jgi:hypothetical protein
VCTVEAADDAVDDAGAAGGADAGPVSGADGCTAGLAGLLVDADPHAVAVSPSAANSEMTWYVRRRRCLAAGIVVPSPDGDRGAHVAIVLGFREAAISLTP